MFELHSGDCLDIMPAIKPMSVDLVLADLPYGTTSLEWDSIIPLDRLWAEYRRVLKPTGCVVLFGSQPFTSKLILSNLPWFKYEIVWSKNKCGSPGLAKFRPMKTHENIVVFAPGKTTYNPQMTTGEPYSRKAPKKVRCNNHGYGFSNENGVENEGTRYPKSVLNIPRDFSAQQQVHPTQKPVSLMEWLVATYSNPGDTVLDNVLGSGPPGVAAVRLGRNFIGIEKDTDDDGRPLGYLDLARERITEAAVSDLF